MKAFNKIMGLSSTDAEVFAKVRSGCSTTKELARKLGKDRSVVQKSLNKLLDKGLVTRRSEYCDDKRGRYYSYCPQDEQEMKKLVKGKVEKLLKKSLEVIT